MRQYTDTPGHVVVRIRFGLDENLTLSLNKITVMQAADELRSVFMLARRVMRTEPTDQEIEEELSDQLGRQVEVTTIED